ncbi:hypothetical protein ACFYO1_02535 [Nocardia sp. NPDC006044]|uniref:hypothetical protein n=1 Tax=Nocardia sp. NPDC006044 TaxID=3364306 RepID=UPI0036CA553D
MFTTNPTTIRRILASTTAAGMIAGAIALAPASAFAGNEPHTPNDGGDTSGWHHIDPLGLNHQETDPLRAAEERENRREYFNNHASTPPRNQSGNHEGAPSWSRVQQPDGRWVVCKPQASWC